MDLMVIKADIKYLIFNIFFSEKSSLNYLTTKDLFSINSAYVGKDHRNLAVIYESTCLP